MPGERENASLRTPPVGGSVGLRVRVFSAQTLSLVPTKTSLRYIHPSGSSSVFPKTASQVFLTLLM